MVGSWGVVVFLIKENLLASMAGASDSWVKPSDLGGVAGHRAVPAPLWQHQAEVVQRANERLK